MPLPRELIVLSYITQLGKVVTGFRYEANLASGSLQ